MFGITSRILAYVCAGMTVTIIVLYTMLKIESGRVDTLKTKVAAYEISEAGYKASLEKSNASIQSLLEEAKKKEKEVADAQESIKGKVAKIEALAYELMTYKASSTDMCLESNKLFDKYLINRNTKK